MPHALAYIVWEGRHDMKLAIFDLDGTVICSKHRHATLPCGALDLEHWVQNSTPQKIAGDSLLPLVNELRACYAKGHKIIICTARVMARADYRFLLNNNIPFDWVISRPKGCTKPDAQHKEERLQKLFSRLKVKPGRAQMWDDNDSVLTMARRIGIKTHDAKQLNYFRGH